MALMEAKVSHGNKQARQHGEGRGGKGRVVGKKVCLKRDLEKKRGFLCLVWQIKSDSMDKDFFSLSNELCLVPSSNYRDCVSDAFMLF